MKDIMEVAEKVASKKSTKDKLVGDSLLEQESVLEGFQIMAHVVWEEVANAIINDIGDNVFASGRPNDLRKVRNLDIACQFDLTKSRITILRKTFCDV